MLTTIKPATLAGTGWTPEERQRFWLDYLDEREGSFAFRCRRYEKVYEQLVAMGLTDEDLVVDVGAGNCEFGRYLYAVRGFGGRYQAVDGCIDGTELADWTPRAPAAFFVAIEVLEHLVDPQALCDRLAEVAEKGIVVTTPNPDVVDVLAMDRTHVTPLDVVRLLGWGFEVQPVQLFHEPGDTLLAWWRA